jgi:hypothetical protein
MIGMSFDYIAKPELLEAPHMKKILEEDRLLCELFHEVCLMNIAKKSTLLPAFRDVFTDALYPVWKEGKVSVRSVFAARVHLDILDSCPNFNGKQVLQEEGHAKLPKQRMLTEEETENAPSNMVIFTNRNLSHISKNNAIQQKLSSSLKP